jgi:hypothetical protein
VQAWIREPMDRTTLTELRELCGRGGIYAENAPARFNTRYRQRIELRQPTMRALSWLARRDDALINRAEIAVDYLFDNWAGRDDAFDFVHQHIVRRWHGKKQEIRVFKPSRRTDTDRLGGTRYDAGRSSPNSIVLYPEKHSRVTGELACLHLEWRLNGLKSVRAAGIRSGRDLIEFNHRQFWQKRLMLYAINRERLGRLIRNRARGNRSKVPEFRPINGFKINWDKRTGDVWIRAHDTVQEVIDQLKASHRIYRALAPISNEVLLPR